MKRSVHIIVVLWALSLSAPPAWSAEPAYRLLSLLTEGGRRAEQRFILRGQTMAEPTELRWEDLARRIWLPPLDACGAEGGEPPPEEICIADAPQSCRRALAVVATMKRTEIAGRGSVICSFSLRDVQITGEGRMLIDGRGRRPLAAAFHFARHPLPSPWDAVRGIVAPIDEIDVAWSIVPEEGDAWKR